MTDETIFAVALEKSNATERAAYLESACGTDAGQRKRVEGLLAALEHAGGFLDKPAVTVPDPESPPTRAYRVPGGDPGDGPTRTHGEDAEDTADALAFLQPSGRPDSLGRIGHYEVLEVLGRGGFGIVFRAFDDVLQRVVAVKVLSPSMAATSPARKRFIREARSAAPIQHENVVRVHAVEESPLPFLVMEFVPGETLQDRLDRTGPLDVAEVLRVGRQVAQGLAAAHAQGLIHRDIKPSNILIESGPQARVKITDFGLARAADDASLTRSGVVAGTPLYMAPEQAKGESLDHRADLFSLGSVLYAMLTGRPPFRAETTLGVLKRVADDTPRPMREVIPEIPEWLCRIVEKLHAKDPAERFQTAREVADVLADCERQLETHKELKDTSRIPAGRKPVRADELLARNGLIAAGLGVPVVFGVCKVLDASWPLVLYVLALLSIAIASFIPYPRLTAAKSKPALRPNRWWRKWVAAALVCLGLVVLGVVVPQVQKGLRDKPQLQGGPMVAWGEVVDPLGKSRFADADGRLTVTVPGDQLYDLNPLPGFNMNAPRVLRAVEGDFEARVTVLPFPRPTVEAGLRAESAYTGAGLVVWLDDNHLLRLFRSGMGHNQGGAPYVHAEWFAVGRHSQQSVYIGDGPLHLRIRRTGGVLRAAHSADGRAWTDVAPPGGDLLLGGRVHVGVGAVNALDREFVARFEGFEVKPPSVSPLANSPQPVLLRAFDPTKDKPVPPVWADQAKSVIVENGVWRIENVAGNGNFNVLLATVLDGIPEDGILIFRAKVKVQAKHKSTWGDLQLGDASPAFHGYDWPKHLYEYRGDVTEWTQKEVRYPVEVLRKKNPPSVPVYVGLHANGVLWVKDAELLHLPAPPGKAIVPPAAVDLLALIDPKRDALQGTWTRDGKALVSAAALGQLQVPFAPPADYRLTMDIERAAGNGSLNFGLIVAGRTACVTLDYKDGLRSGICGIDGKMLRKGDAVFEGPALAPGRNVVVAEVRGNRIVVRAGATTVIDWESDSARLTVIPLWAKTDGKRPYLGNAGGGYRFHRLELTPLPPLAVAPFDAAQAQAHQEAWAKHLGVPVETTNSVGMTLRLIPPGEFKMGYTPDQSKRLVAETDAVWERNVILQNPARPVTVAEPFYLGAHEVTLGQFRHFVEAKKYKTTAERDGKGGLVYDAGKKEFVLKKERIWSKPEPEMTDDHPVMTISAADAEAFCAWLSEVEGRKYALPHDAQWEFACRGGTATLWWTGDDPKVLLRHENVEGSPKPAGWLSVNPFGLFDMHGNVCELVQTSDGYKSRSTGGGPARVGSSAWGTGVARDRAHVRTGFRVAIVGDLKTPSDAGRLQGTWVPVAGQVDGKPMTEEALREFSEVLFRGNSFRFHQGGAPVTAEFRLDPAKTPKEIDIIQAGTERTMPGIYRFRGDELELCLGSALLPRPRDFAPQPGSGSACVTLRRKADAPPKKEPPNSAVIQPLKDAVAAKGRVRDTTKQRFDAGVVSKIELLAAEAELTEARVKLVEAEGDEAVVVALLEELVKQRQEERDLIAIRVELGVDRQETVDQADARLAGAKSRLAKVKPPPAVAPAPRPKPNK